MGGRPAGRCDKGKAKGRRVETANVQVILCLPHLPFSRSILSPPLGSRKLIPEDFLTSLPPSCIQPIRAPPPPRRSQVEGERAGAFLLPTLPSLVQHQLRSSNHTPPQLLLPPGCPKNPLSFLPYSFILRDANGFPLMLVSGCLSLLRLLPYPCSPLCKWSLQQTLFS